MISDSVKRECVSAKNGGQTARTIYNNIYLKSDDPRMNLKTFRNKLAGWAKNPAFSLPPSLEGGTYPGFIAHGATVQVDADGTIRQAWIKQHDDRYRMDELIEAIKTNSIPVYLPEIKPEPSAEGMLEIPLFDLHFPLSAHAETMQGVCQIIRRQKWDTIYIIIGQDLFHNDDFRGRTSSGRPIEAVDMVKAWRMATTFWQTIIIEAIGHANDVQIIYSKGNHDESFSWAFAQQLRAMFPSIYIDDSLSQRKAITWRGCFIGITHGAYQRSTNNDLRGQFTMQFPAEFAAASVREIHAGHLHNEREGDVYGVMVRRLCRSGFTDSWSDDEGFVGSHSRFMLFEFVPNRLKSIHYI